MTLNAEIGGVPTVDLLRFNKAMMSCALTGLKTTVSLSRIKQMTPWGQCAVRFIIVMHRY